MYDHDDEILDRLVAAEDEAAAVFRGEIPCAGWIDSHYFLDEGGVCQDCGAAI